MPNGLKLRLRGQDEKAVAGRVHADCRRRVELCIFREDRFKIGRQLRCVGVPDDQHPNGALHSAANLGGIDIELNNHLLGDIQEGRGRGDDHRIELRIGGHSHRGHQFASLLLHLHIAQPSPARKRIDINQLLAGQQLLDEELIDVNALPSWPRQR